MHTVITFFTTLGQHLLPPLIALARWGSRALNRTSDRIRFMLRMKAGPELERGATLVELMLAMAVIAIVAVGGLMAFGEVRDRAVGGNLFNGSQGLHVDVLSYLTDYHTDTPSGMTEGAAEGQANSRQTLGTAQSATVPQVNPGNTQCTAVDVPWTGCSGSGAGSVTQTVPNPNRLRFQNMPSLSFGDGEYDEDIANEWYVPFGTNGLEIGFDIIPDNTPFGQGSGVWNHCTFSSTTGTDVAVAVQIAFDGLGICNNYAQRTAQLDHVQDAICYDQPAWIAATGGTWPITGTTSGDSVLNICYHVMRQ